MAAIAAPIDAGELLPRILKMRETLLEHRKGATPEVLQTTDAFLEELEDLIEDILDFQDSMQALDAGKSEGLIAWEDLKASLGL